MQYTFGVMDPNETSGAELAQMLTQFAQSLYAGHRGGTRPTYAIRGTIWFLDTGARYMQMMMFDGVDDILLGTVDTINNTFQAAFDTNTFNINSIGGVPNTRSVTGALSLAGGGNLGADRALTLVNDNNAPGALRYYGTDANGTKGFHALPNNGGTTGGTIRIKLLEVGPGNYNYVVPGNCIAMDFDLRSGQGGTSGRLFDQAAGQENPVWVEQLFGGALGCRAVGTIQTTPGETLSLSVGARGADANVSAGGGNFVSGTDGGWTSLNNWFAMSGGQAGNLNNNPVPGGFAIQGANANRVYNWGFYNQDGGDYSGHFKGNVGNGLAVLWGWLRV